MRRWVLVLVVAGLAAWTSHAAAPGSPRALPGWPLYDRYCLACHGSVGDGRGPAAPFTAGRPRDLTRGEYKWRSTHPGQPPTDDDLRATLQHGASGTSMHGFALTRPQLDQLVEVVKAFAPPATFAQPGKVFELGTPPRSSDPGRGAELWMKLGCVACHGLAGDGDTPAGRTMAWGPYDLTRGVHRPRPTDDRASKRRAIAMSIATGLAGTPMPSYVTALPETDIWALADHVLGFSASARASDATALDARTIALDRTAKVGVGVWPGQGDLEEAKLFGGPIAPQGPPPASLGPAQASLQAKDCGRCHAKQYREWQPSLHRGATSPGLAAQMYGMKREAAAACLRCHAPLPEQQDDPGLLADGASCAGCHVRAWGRHGPPDRAPSLLPIPAYPLEELAIYERADFCLPCHQLPPRTAVAGKPLLNTYKEWLEGPYMRRGVQCQHCHMPNREHTFRGVHDPAMFRDAIALTARAHVKDGAVTVVAELTNVGAGHYLPTTPTPAAWISIELLDARGTPIEGAAAKHRIGRDVAFNTRGDRRWIEREDTRIPPGETTTMARAWSGGRTAAATAARVTVSVHPDDYYERLYEAQLRRTLPAPRRALYEQALARGRANRYIAVQREISISRP